jgi:hypothetical protein
MQTVDGSEPATAQGRKTLCETKPTDINLKKTRTATAHADKTNLGSTSRRLKTLTQ